MYARALTTCKVDETPFPSKVGKLFYQSGSISVSIRILVERLRDQEKK